MRKRAATIVVTPGAEQITVSLPKSLLCEIETLTTDMDLTNDELVELALKELIERQRAHEETRKQIASAYGDYPDESEQMWQAAMRERQKRLSMETDDGC
jgi:metal-responsive CopG/Arc/MetJ family transcriptional regulator